MGHLKTARPVDNNNNSARTLRTHIHKTGINTNVLLMTGYKKRTREQSERMKYPGKTHAAVAAAAGRICATKKCGMPTTPILLGHRWSHAARDATNCASRKRWSKAPTPDKN